MYIHNSTIWYQNPVICHNTVIHSNTIYNIAWIRIASSLLKTKHLFQVAKLISSGLHLGNDSRGAKYSFIRVRGGNGVKIRVRKYTTSRGVWGHAPPENFCILDSLRLLLMHSQVPENDQK